MKVSFKLNGLDTLSFTQVKSIQLDTGRRNRLKLQMVGSDDNSLVLCEWLRSIDNSFKTKQLGVKPPKGLEYRASLVLDGTVFRNVFPVMSTTMGKMAEVEFVYDLTTEIKQTYPDGYEVYQA